MQCEHIRRNGNRCRCSATRNQVLCFNHLPAVPRAIMSAAEIRECICHEFVLMEEKRRELMDHIRGVSAILSTEPKPDPAVLNAAIDALGPAAKAAQYQMERCKVLRRAERLMGPAEKLAGS